MGQMAQNDRMNAPKTGQKTEADRRAERLRAALRDNLKRRKAQAKAKSSGAVGDIGGRTAAPEAARGGDSSTVQEGKYTPNSAGFAGDKTSG